MRFIQITLMSDHTGYIFIDEIIAIKGALNSSMLVMSTGEYIEVKESPTEVYQLIKKEQLQ